MEIFYKNGEDIRDIGLRVDNAIYRANSRGQEIKEIVLTPEEWKEFKFWIRNLWQAEVLDSESVCYRSVIIRRG